MIVLKDPEVQYCAVRKSTFVDFVWKHIFPFIKKNLLIKLWLSDTALLSMAKELSLFCHGLIVCVGPCVLLSKEQEGHG